jgi:hypothetical protein
MNISEKDIDDIKNTIILIQKFMKIPEISKLKNKNFEEYSDKLKSIFPCFEKNYSSLFKLVIQDRDLSCLDLILNGMLNISKGNDKETEEKAIGELLAEKFISYK